MTLPSQINLPLPTDFPNVDDQQRYTRDLVLQLQSMYEKISNNVNGFIRNDTETDSAQWIPTLNGSTSGTFTYSSQVGWAIRQGIFTELFFDITWTATTASGNLFLDLPYIVTLSSGKPFVGILQPSNITYGGGISNLVINAIPNTYTGEIWTVGSGIPTANLAVPPSGQLIGRLFYIGIEDE